MKAIISVCLSPVQTLQTTFDIIMFNSDNSDDVEMLRQMRLLYLVY